MLKRVKSSYTCLQILTLQIIVLSGCQFGIQLYDWDGTTLIHSYDFQENGIGVDGKLVTGGMVKGDFQMYLCFN